MHPLVALLLSYLLGSIPSAYIAGRVLAAVDLREHGSGNLGATNVFRVLGVKAGVAVLIADTAKGAIPVWLLPGTAGVPDSEIWALAFGVAAILGHIRPVFLLWRGGGGGKGVATAGGVFLALAPLSMLASTAVWVVVLLVSGYVSLASLAAAVVLPASLLLLRGPESRVFMVSVAIAAFVIWAHRANIGRLRRGEENRFGRKKAAT